MYFALDQLNHDSSSLIVVRIHGIVNLLASKHYLQAYCLYFVMSD